MFSKFGSREINIDVQKKDAVGGSPQPKAQTQPKPDAQPKPEAPPVRQEVAKPKPSVSVIGKTLELKGELIASEDLLIQGQVEGSVENKAKYLMVGADGNVRADINGRNVTVQGTVHGDIRGNESVVVESSARVEGNIYSSSIGLEKGARFKGSIDSLGKAAAAEAGQISEEAVDKILDA